MPPPRFTAAKGLPRQPRGCLSKRNMNKKHEQQHLQNKTAACSVAKRDSAVSACWCAAGEAYDSNVERNNCLAACLPPNPCVPENPWSFIARRLASWNECLRVYAGTAIGASELAGCWRSRKGCVRITSRNGVYKGILPLSDVYRYITRCSPASCSKNRITGS